MLTLPKAESLYDSRDSAKFSASKTGIVFKIASVCVNAAVFVLLISPVIAVQPVVDTSTNKDSKESLNRGLAYLLKKQAQDGSWKSEYYGNLKEGAATTSLVVFALSTLPKPLLKKEKASIQKAFEFLKKGIAKYGYVANESGPDYANYATSMTLLADRHFRARCKWNLLTEKERCELVDFLVSSQLDETHGMSAEMDDFGGWDLSGWRRERRLSPGTNISVSSFVLMALETESGNKVDQVRARANRWLNRLRNPDHGFHFHPKKDHEGNKAAWSDELFKNPKSYGTATLDGVRSLRTLGRLEEIEKSVKWLIDNQIEEAGSCFVPGFEFKKGEQDYSWGQGLLYYYFASLALESDLLPDSFRGQCKRRLTRYLIEKQKGDGSWQNSSTRMREDDPMIATPLAIIALSRFQN